MAGLGGIGACAIGGAGAAHTAAEGAVFLLDHRFFRQAAIFDKLLPLAAVFAKESACPAVFDKTRNIAVPVVTEE